MIDMLNTLSTLLRSPVGFDGNLMTHICRAPAAALIQVLEGGAALLPHLNEKLIQSEWFTTTSLQQRRAIVSLLL